MDLSDVEDGVGTMATEAVEAGAEALAIDMDLEGLKNMAGVMVDMEVTVVEVQATAGQRLTTMDGRARWRARIRWIGHE